MKTLSAKGQKLLKVFHLLFNFMWIGGSIQYDAAIIRNQPSRES